MLLLSACAPPGTACGAKTHTRHSAQLEAATSREIER
jgi:hypothetical protein